MKTVNIVVSGLLLATSLIAEGTKVSGFVDAQYHWVKDGANQGFLVNDGALYINHDAGVCTAMIDVPFNSKDTALTGANFSIAAAKMQAFVSHKYNSGLGWKLGQFDSPFGLEANDSKDTAMARTGIVKTVLPAVITGAGVDYSLGGTKISVIFANRADNSALGHAGEASSDVGLLVNAGFGGLKVAAGGLFGKFGAETGYLIDAVVNYPMGKLDVGFEFNMQKNRITGVTDNTMGIVGLVGYGISDMMGVDLRVSYLSKGDAATDSKMQFSFGPNFTMSKSMKCKVHYSMDSSTPTGGAATTSHSAVISSVVSF